MRNFSPVLSVSDLERRAADAAQFLREFANEHRLMILCRLAAGEEWAVTPLATSVGLSASALSQHLARLREDGIVSFRREGQTIFYRLTDERTGRVLALLNELFRPQTCNSEVDEDDEA